MFKQEVVERKKKDYAEEMLVTLELIEAKKQEEIDIMSEISDSYSSMSYGSIFGDMQQGYDY